MEFLPLHSLRATAITEPPLRTIARERRQLLSRNLARGVRLSPRRHLGDQPDGRALEVPAPVLLAVAQAARLNVSRVEILLVVAVVRDEPRATVRTVDLKSALRSGRRLLVAAAKSQVKLLARLFRSVGHGAISKRSCCTLTCV